MTETTRIDEIHDGIYRIHTPVAEAPGGFSFNQYLVVDDEPLLFHMGPEWMVGGVKAAIERVLPIERLRWIGFSHHEADENGAMGTLLAAAPRARAVGSSVAALVGNVTGEGRGLADGEEMSTGKRTWRWLSAPHFPHGWDCGFLLDVTSRTLFCGDLFTQPGLGEVAVTEGDVLGPSEKLRERLDYFAHGRGDGDILAKLVATEPTLLACMHGSAWRGDGAQLLRALGEALSR